MIMTETSLSQNRSTILHVYAMNIKVFVSANNQEHSVLVYDIS